MGDHRLPKRVMSRGLESAGYVGREERERMDGLLGRGSSGVWHNGGLENHRNRPWVLVLCKTVCEGGCKFMVA